MGFLPYSNAVHYDDKPERRAAFLARDRGRHARRLRHRRRRGAALRRHATWPQVVTSRPHARAYHVTPDGADVIETELATQLPGTPVAVEPALAA